MGGYNRPLDSGTRLADPTRVLLGSEWSAARPKLFDQQAAVCLNAVSLEVAVVGLGLGRHERRLEHLCAILASTNDNRLINTVLLGQLRSSTLPHLEIH